MKSSARIAACSLVLGLATAAAARSQAGPSTDPVRESAAARATDANITRLTTVILLEHSQFAHHPLDPELARALLDRYLDALDGLAQPVPAGGRGRVRAATARRWPRPRASPGDTTAAHAIFARYLQRLEQQVAYVRRPAAGRRVRLHGPRRLLVRSGARGPAATLAAAQALWRQQLRAEYLQEKLADKPAAEDRRHAAAPARRSSSQNDEDAARRRAAGDLPGRAGPRVRPPLGLPGARADGELSSIAMNLSLFGIGASLESDGRLLQDPRADARRTGGCAAAMLKPGRPHRRRGAGRAGAGRHREHAALARRGADPRRRRARR